MLSLLLQAASEVPGWASLGVGGVLAGGMFYFYRQDRKGSEEKLSELSKDFRGIVQENTKAITKLCTFLEEGTDAGKR